MKHLVFLPVYDGEEIQDQGYMIDSIQAIRPLTNPVTDKPRSYIVFRDRQIAVAMDLADLGEYLVSTGAVAAHHYLVDEDDWEANERQI